MSDTGTKRLAPGTATIAGRVLAGLILLGCAVMIWTHEVNDLEFPPRITGTEASIDQEQVDLTRRAAAAVALHESIGFLVTLCLAASALMGFTVRDGFSHGRLAAVVGPILTAIFVLVITRSFISAYDAYNTIAVQLEYGVLFINSIRPMIEMQAFMAVLAGGCAVSLLALRLWK